MYAYHNLGKQISNPSIIIFYIHLNAVTNASFKRHYQNREQDEQIKSMVYDLVSHYCSFVCFRDFIFTNIQFINNLHGSTGSNYAYF